MFQFQSTFPCWERPIYIAFHLLLQNFNPRSRVGNDSFLHFNHSTIIISIHVPVLGTTFVSHSFALPIQFQSTFPCWERRNFYTKQRPFFEFQSTFPCWERHKATKALKQKKKFQSTFPCWERLIGPRTFHVTARISIHVPVLGTTMIDFWLQCQKAYFNPRSRVGNDAFKYLYSSVALISIHVPVLGTTERSGFFCE